MFRGDYQHACRLVYVIMTYALTKIKKFWFLYKSIGRIGFGLQILPKTHLDWDFLLKYDEENDKLYLIIKIESNFF